MPDFKPMNPLAGRVLGSSFRSGKMGPTVPEQEAVMARFEAAAQAKQMEFMLSHRKEQRAEEEFAWERTMDVARERRLLQGETFRQAEAFRKEQSEGAKYLIGQWKEMREETPSGAYRNHLDEVIGNFYNQLSPFQQGAVQVIVRGTALDPMEAKMIRFDKLFKAPESPEIDSSANPIGYNLAYADYAFRSLEHNRTRMKFADSSITLPAMPELINLGEDLWATKVEGEPARLMNAESLQLEEFAKKRGVSSNYVIAHGGFAPLQGKKAQVIQIGGQQEYVTPLESINGSTKVDRISIGKAPQGEGRGAKGEEFPSSIEELLVSWNVGELEEPMKGYEGAQMLIKQIEDMSSIKGVEIQEVVDRVLGGAHPGYTFIASPSAEFNRRSFWPDTWSEGKRGYLTVMVGKKTRFKTKDGRFIELVYDQTTGMVKDFNGFSQGTLEDTMDHVQNHTLEELKVLQGGK